MSTDLAIVLGVAGAFVAFLANAIAVIVAIYKLGTAVGKFEVIGRQQSMEISELKITVKEIANLVTSMAVQTQRQDELSQRVTRIETVVDELRHGEGIVLPLTKSPYEAR